MAETQVYLAVDIGASSGRVLAGLFDGAELKLEEVHRFQNGPVRVADSLQWPLLSQWQHVLDGLRASAVRYGDSIVSIGVDTWGVDFGLLDRNDCLLSNPVHYRDARTTGMMAEALERVSREEIFSETGIQFMELNTLFQLLSLSIEESPLLEVADRFLMMPDVFHWLLTGEKSNEFTNVTTTQCFNPTTGTWANSMLEKLDIPTAMFGKITPPGTGLGTLRHSVSDATGLAKHVTVVLPGTHDTASAVMAVPAKSNEGQAVDWCYISSGTWSLMGVEVDQPVINDPCRKLNFTNEGGVGDTIRLLKNIGGLWLVQECRRIWALDGRDYGWSQLTALADKSPPLASIIDPDAQDFVAPANMPAAIQDYCRRTGQTVPDTEGAVIRCALESLANRYRYVLSALEDLADSQIDTVHIVGGGTQNRQLCQMAADACNRQVIAGPVEATAIGNVMVQALSNGGVGSIAEARQAVGNSFSVESFLPQQTAPWDEAYERFLTLG